MKPFRIALIALATVAMSAFAARPASAASPWQLLHAGKRLPDALPIVVAREGAASDRRAGDARLAVVGASTRATPSVGFYCRDL